jgi:hypothetical protein
MRTETEYYFDFNDYKTVNRVLETRKEKSFTEEELLSQWSDRINFLLQEGEITSEEVNGDHLYDLIRDYWDFSSDKTENLIHTIFNI